MSKAMGIKEVIIKWEQKNGRKVSEVKEVKFVGCSPPLEKMDSALNALAHVERLSLSTNCIEKIAYLNLFKHLKVLALSRNNIKSTAGLEGVGEVLEELWLSYNLIERLSGVGALKRLKVFYMSNNYVKEWSEFNKLTELPSLEDLLFVGNPLEEKHSVDATWRKEVAKRLPNLKKLDGVPVVKETGEEAVLGVLLSGLKDTDSDQINQYITSSFY